MLVLAVSAAITFLLPVFCLLRLWRGRWRSRGEWWINLALCATFLTLACLVGTWAVLGFHLRYPLLPLFIAAVFASRRRRETPPRALPHRMLLKSALLLALLLLNGVAASGRFYEGESLNLLFPLQKGRYSVLQGGSNRMVNPFHSSSPAERFAVDLVKLNRGGGRASRLASGKLSDYAVFGESVLSPCAGFVVEAFDGAPDNPPGEVDSKHPSGNHAVLACGETRVLLAHLLRGSLSIRTGDRIGAGTVIGRVGNSGFSAEPHLHLSAWREGADGRRHPVPILLNGRFPVLNDLFLAE